MSEPTNPLFEEEKEFLERKKLEYERALRGDVEHIKEQTVHVGKLALIGAGVASGIWLLTKAFGGRKQNKKQWHYADEDEADYNFGEDGYYDDDEERDDDRPWSDSRYYDDEIQDYADAADSHESYSEDSEDDLDDNGLSEFPDFEAHSSSHHGDEQPASHYDALADTDGMASDEYLTDAPQEIAPAPIEDRPFWSEEHSHPTANLPYDDSRRLPDSNSFAAPTPTEEVAQASPEAKKKWLGPILKSFMKSETGRVLAGQAAAMALALATKAVKDMLPSDGDKPVKTSDLATSTAAAGARAYGEAAPLAAPQSPVLDAKDPDANASAAPTPAARNAS